MEPQGASGTPWMPRLTLETYLNLKHLDAISPLILRKILTLHGFKSTSVPKSDLMDAVRSIELMDAHHSTLQSDVSSDALLSLNDVIRDLSHLHWQECCITSVETINSTTAFGSWFGEESTKRMKSDCNSASSSKKIKHSKAGSQIVVVNEPDQMGPKIKHKAAGSLIAIVNEPDHRGPKIKHKAAGSSVAIVSEPYQMGPKIKHKAAGSLIAVVSEPDQVGPKIGHKAAGSVVAVVSKPDQAGLKIKHKAAGSRIAVVSEPNQVDPSVTTASSSPVGMWKSARVSQFPARLKDYY